MKESLTVTESLQALQAGVERGGATVAASLCVSDGGDGFLDAYAALRPSRWVPAPATGPLGAQAEAAYLLDKASPTAAIEIALSSGLQLVPPEKRDVMRSTTAGVADLIARALHAGATRVLVGLGGSATCDGGLGLVARLAERLLGLPPGAPRSPGNFDAAAVAPRLPELRAALHGIELVGCTDVSSPLAGPAGSAALFAPQKGATPEQVALLDQLLGQWAGEAEQQLREPLRWRPGAGAAGGLGFAILALGGSLRPGAGLLCELMGYDQLLGGCDAIITSEGRFDKTSLRGKAPWEVAHRAALAGRGAAIACGSADPDAAAEAATSGVTILPFSEAPPVSERAKHAPRLLAGAATRYVALLRPARA